MRLAATAALLALSLSNCKPPGRCDRGGTGLAEPPTGAAPRPDTRDPIAVASTDEVGVVGQPVELTAATAFCLEDPLPVLGVVAEVLDDQNQPVAHELVRQALTPTGASATIRFTPRRARPHFVKLRLEPSLLFVQRTVQVAEDHSSSPRRQESVPAACGRPLALESKGVLCLDERESTLDLWRDGSRAQRFPAAPAAARSGATVWLGDVTQVQRWRDEGQGPLVASGFASPGFTVRVVAALSDTEAVAVGDTDFAHVRALPDAGLELGVARWRGSSDVRRPAEATVLDGTVFVLAIERFGGAGVLSAVALDGGWQAIVSNGALALESTGAWVLENGTLGHGWLDADAGAMRDAAPFALPAGFTVSSRLESGGSIVTPSPIVAPVFGADAGTYLLRREPEGFALEWYGDQPRLSFARERQAFGWADGGLWVVERR